MKKVKVLSVVSVLLLSFVLLAGCSNSEQKTTQGTVKTGLGQSISIQNSKDATADADGVAQVDATIAAVSVDDAGKIVSVKIDQIQTPVSFSKAGAITADKTAELKTKVEKGEEYGMKKASSIGKEWYEEIAALEAWMVGKTIDEVKAMKTKESDGKILTDEPDLTSSVTISVGEFIEVVEEAITNAK
jgi:hypothetical protein